MAWQSAGTITATNGSTAITGVGTSFITAAKLGEALLVGDSSYPYEIVAITSATGMTISPAYQGGTVAGAAYRIMPVKGILDRAYDALREAIDLFEAAESGILSGKFPTGTAALPSISTPNDPDTGLSFPAANQLGWSTGGVRRMLMSNTALTVDVDVAGTGVQTDPKSNTANKLLRVGAFGLGAALNYSSGAPFSTASDTTGFIHHTSIASGPGDSPVGAQYHQGISVAQSGGSRGMQFVVSSNNRAFFRTHAAAVFAAWRELYHSNNILGTVSQSGGTPTGAIIERGSNANGEYAKFADGTMIATIISFSLTYNSGSTCQSDWTFPVAFDSPPAITGVVNASNTLANAAPPLDALGPVMWSNSGSNSLVARMSVRRVTGQTSFVSGNYVVVQNLTAIGRWF